MAQLKGYLKDKDSNELFLTNMFDMMWPIGRGFIDFTDTDYSNWLGFTWERELVGMTPVGYNQNDSDFNEIGKTGGNKTHSHTQGVTGAWSGTSGNTSPGTNSTGAHTHNYGVQYAAYYGALYDSDEKLLRLYNGSTNKYVAGESTGSQEKTSGNYNVYPGMGSTFSSNIYQNLQPTSSNGSHSHTVNAHNHSIPSHTHTNPNTNSASNLSPYKVVAYWKRVK